MTTPEDPNNPNRSPFTPQVHQSRQVNSNTGIGQDAQRGMRSKLIESIMQLVVQAITGVFLPGPLGSAFTQLSSWAQSLGQTILGPLVTILVGVLDSIPIVGPPLGDALEDLALLFGLMKTTTNVAQDSADTANVGLAILTGRVNGIVTGGVSLWDTFSRRVNDMATDPDWDVEYFNGPGSMGLYENDAGIAHWDAVGFSDAAFIARHRTPLGTQNQRVSFVINSFTYGYAGNQAHCKLMTRMDATRRWYVMATIELGSAEIGYVLNGVYTRMGAVETVSTANGDLWDFEAGSIGDTWRFRLLQNNAVRVDRTDLGHVSMRDTTPGTTYTYVGFGGDCAIGAGAFPGTTYQIGMPDFQVVAAADFI